MTALVMIADLTVWPVARPPLPDPRKWKDSPAVVTGFEAAHSTRPLGDRTQAHLQFAAPRPMVPALPIR